MDIKIIDVTVHIIKSDLNVPFAFSQGWVKKRSATIVEVKQMKVSLDGGKHFVKD